MGQNSSIIGDTAKEAPVKGNIIVDASDSCVSGVKLRSTGIIPISELIKQEKCSKNIQKIEKNYYNKKKIVNKKPKEEPKKKKPDFIDTSYEDLPARRQWVRINPEPINPFECDAIKVGLKKPSSKTILNVQKVGVQNRIQDGNQPRISEQIREKSRNNSKRDTNRNNIQHANRETVKYDIREDVRPPTRKGIRKNVGIGTDDYNNKDMPLRSIKKTEPKNIVTERKFKETSTQTITKDKATSYENFKQIYKRNEVNEKQRSRHNYQDVKETHEKTKKEVNKIKQPKHYKAHSRERSLRDIEEESTHQIQIHDISNEKRKSRRFDENLRIDTKMLCSITPEKNLQWQTHLDENKLERRAGRNYINRKLAGEYNSGDSKLASRNNDINNFNSNCDVIESSVSLLPSASTLEQAIREHRKYVSAKEALESWKNLHTWKQHKKRFERTRNKVYQDNFDVATQTMFIRPTSLARNRSSDNYMQTYSATNEDGIVPSEKHLYKDFILKMEHCLQKHSRLCELNAKRNGEAKYTWVQDKHRRWHKITFDDYKK